MSVMYFLWISIFALSCTTINAATQVYFPFRNISLPWTDRVDDLVSRLTLEEMVQQMTDGGGAQRKPCPAIRRLGIKPYNFDTECLRGVMQNPATPFPQSIGLAASFSPDLLYDVAEVIAVEARAIYNNASGHGVYPIQKSISCLAPFINIMRHPLWGRVQEVYGEDPYLSGVLAAAYVRGLQGNHSRYVRANAGCKVVSVHSGPENIPVSRFSFNSIVSERDFRLTYLPNFKKCVEAGSYNLMCSYNSINGVPACANKNLLTDILRKEFGFKGYFISDEGAIERIYTAHKYVNSSLEAAVAAVNAGVNLDLPPTQPCFGLLTQAVMKGLVSFDTIVERVKPLFYTRMRLGEFDPPQMNPYTNIGLDVIESAAHRNAAIDTATKTFVLLKNDNNFLPIRKRISKLAVVGPMADNINELYGDYSTIPVVKYVKTPYVGLKPLADVTHLAPGCQNNICDKYDSEAVKNATEGADMVVVCLGTGNAVESEGHDRSDLELPGHQLQLLQDAVSFAAGAPVVLLVFSAGPLNISYAKSSSRIPAMLQCWFPAQATGEALYRVMSAIQGPPVSPSARLPYTWPQSLDQVPPMVNYSMEGRTYRYFKGIPLYPFGYGLSYSTFHYSEVHVPASIQAGQNVTVTAKVLNNGPYVADEIVQLYIRWEKCTVPMPQIQLAGVSRVHLSVKQQLNISFIITAEQMKVWHDDKGFMDHIGMMSVWLGGQQPLQITTAHSNMLYATFTITN